MKPIVNTSTFLSGLSAVISVIEKCEWWESRTVYVNRLANSVAGPASPKDTRKPGQMGRWDR